MSKLLCNVLKISGEANALPWLHLPQAMGVGRGEGRPKPPLNLEIISKKVVFSISRSKKQISPLSAPSWKKIWENPLLSPWKKTSNGHASSSGCIQNSVSGQSPLHGSVITSSFDNPTALSKTFLDGPVFHR